MLVFRGQSKSTGHRCEGPQIYSMPTDVYICCETDSAKRVSGMRRSSYPRYKEISQTFRISGTGESPQTSYQTQFDTTYRACHCDTLRRAHHSFLTRCTGWRKNNRTDHHISYLNMLKKTTKSKSIEAIMRWRRILFAGFVARIEDTRLPKCAMFGELVGGAGCVGNKENKSGWSVSWSTSGLLASTPTSGWQQSRSRWDGARRRKIHRFSVCDINLRIGVNARV